MARSANPEFDAFVERQKKASADRPAAQPIDWDKELQDWLTYLKDLYVQIQSFLKPHIDEGSVSCEFEDITLTEENIGTYTAKKMIINIGDDRIYITPIGTLLIGSKGRVDVEGRAGRARLALINESAKSFRDMIKVTVTIVDRAKEAQAPTDRSASGDRNIKWIWKIISSPPAATFTDLTAEAFLQMLLEVSNG